MQAAAQRFAVATIRSAVSSEGSSPFSASTSITTWCSAVSMSLPNSCRPSAITVNGGDLGAQSAGEVVDLGRCCVAAGVHAEVHPHLEGGRCVRADAECDCGIHGDVHPPVPTGGCGI